MKMKASEVARFKKALLEKKQTLMGDVSQMETQALKASEQDFSVDHMADHGSDNYEQDLTLGLIETEEKVLNDIEDALKRISEGTFGLCERCEKNINKARLEALPHARYCLDCQKKTEQGVVDEDEEDE